MMSRKYRNRAILCYAASAFFSFGLIFVALWDQDGFAIVLYSFLAACWLMTATWQAWKYQELKADEDLHAELEKYDIDV